MPINYHPKKGAILICDFSTGFRVPEMVKRRPVIVVSPPIGTRPRLCTIVPISTQPPIPAVPYQFQIEIDPPLPAPWHEGPNWVKADMMFAASFDRLDLIRDGKDECGNRKYREHIISETDLKRVRSCLLKSLGMGGLTEHL